MPSNIETSETPRVIRVDNDEVATVTLNRPDEFNALSREMLSALQAVLDELAADATVRVVVIAAKGKVFCGGHDVREMRREPSRTSQEALFRQCGEMMLTLMRMPQPVIARVQGGAAAAGCQLAAMCDLVLAADVAKFSVPGIRLGLFCSTPAVALSRAIGRKQAMEMLFTGNAIDARQAERFGLVNRVVPLDRLDEEVDRLARSLLEKPASVLAMGKRLFYAQLEIGMESAMRLASEAMVDNMMGKDAQHGFDCFLEKKAPAWAGTPNESNGAGRERQRVFGEAASRSSFSGTRPG